MANKTTLIENGDFIEYSIEGKEINLLVDEGELLLRKKKWKNIQPKIKSGYLSKYIKLVSSPKNGAVCL